MDKSMARTEVPPKANELGLPPCAKDASAAVPNRSVAAIKNIVFMNVYSPTIVVIASSLSVI
jgi:hypothetical protein